MFTKMKSLGYTILFVLFELISTSMLLSFLFFPLLFFFVAIDEEHKKDTL